MTWLRRRSELRRVLERLKAAEGCIRDLENDLREERERNRAREDYLLSQVLTAAGRYGLPKELSGTTNKTVTQPPTQSSNSRADGISVRDSYRKFCAQTGRSEQEADAMWERWKRGDLPASPVVDEPFTFQ